MAIVSAPTATWDFSRQVQKAFSGFRESRQNDLISLPFVLTPTISAANVTTTNTVRMFRFPAGTYLLDFTGKPSDMDSSTGLVYDIVLLDSADAEQTQKLVSGSTGGQAGTATDTILVAAKYRFVGNLWCCFKVTTAATTPVAGTYRCGFSISRGVIGLTEPSNGRTATTVAIP